MTFLVKKRTKFEKDVYTCIKMLEPKKNHTFFLIREPPNFFIDIQTFTFQHQYSVKAHADQHYHTLVSVIILKNEENSPVYCSLPVVQSDKSDKKVTKSDNFFF